MPRIPAALLLAATGLLARTARAEPPAEHESTAPVFSIAKSENKNQVQYVVGLDNHCAPLGPTPVSAYWRMLETGPTATAPLLAREVRGYGLASQAVIARDASGGQIRAVLNSLPGRPLTIATSRGADGECHALATLAIAGAPAHLFNVYVRVRWYGVDYVLLQGWSMDGTHVLREKL